MAEQVFANFIPSLAVGQLNENVVKHEFRYNGIPVVDPPPGKQPFDFFLPDGRACEAKIDLRSQATGKIALEWPTLQRGAGIYILTTTVARVFTSLEVQAMYNRGKVPAGGFGQQGYDGRYTSLTEYYNSGMRLRDFIYQLKQQQ